MSVNAHQFCVENHDTTSTSSSSNTVPEDSKRLTIPFQLPANFLVCGESNSGKSTWVENLIKHKNSMLNPAPAKVLVLYRRKQPMYDQWESNYEHIRCIEGIQKEALEEVKNDTDAMQKGGYLLILDDLMVESLKDAYVLSLFTAGRHQGFSGVISIWHNLMPKNGRTIGLNTHVYILMRSPRIGSQVPTLGSQLGIRKAISEAYTAATENQPYSYLVADFSDKKTPGAWNYALRSNIWPCDNGPTIAYSRLTGPT